MGKRKKRLLKHLFTDRLMAKQGTIMVVDDNKSILQALELLLPRYFAKVITLSNPNQIDSTLRENAVDVALLDMNYSSKVNNGNEGLYWLSYVKERFPSVYSIRRDRIGG